MGLRYLLLLLAVAGAIPKYLSLNAFIEEGMPVEQLDRIVGSLAAAARDIGVAVAAGDTGAAGRQHKTRYGDLGYLQLRRLPGNKHGGGVNIEHDAIVVVASCCIRDVGHGGSAVACDLQ